MTVAAEARELPEYRELYYEWENGQWAAGAIDLHVDERQWRDFPSDLKRSLLWTLSSFHVRGQRSAHALVSFIDAAPTEEQQVILSTQLVDEARHAVFFDRFYSEAVDEDGSDMKSRLDAQVDRLNDGFRTLLFDMLPAAARRIHDKMDLDSLVEGLVLYHIVIQGTLASTGQRFLLNYLRERDILPGFRKGFSSVARDGSRHVNFAVRFLQEVVAAEAHYAGVIRGNLDDLIPDFLSALDPPAGDMSYFGPLPYGATELSDHALDSLNQRLREIGVELAS